MTADTQRWREWHQAYDREGSPLVQRLLTVQACIREALDAAPPGPIRVVSMCAGEARDLVGALDGHPRVGDVAGRVVELDPQLAARARADLPEAIEVVCGDASTTSAYEGAVPANLVLVCGVFGNITDEDISATIASLPMLCAPSATVVWTRHRRPPDRTDLARAEFAAAGFAEIAFVAPEGFLFGVGAHRLASPPQPFVAGRRLFEFVGYDRFGGETCAECGFTYALGRSEIVAWLRGDATAFAARLRAFDGDAVRARPDPDTWSPLEYACHVRDVLRVQQQRLDLIARTNEPALEPMRREERAIEDRYNDQDPEVVATELVAAAAALADTLTALGDAGWRRTALYNYPTPQLRTVEWIGTHTVHELLHHRRDITLPRGS